MAGEAIHDGGCLCGAVRYRAVGAPSWVSHCHCESCRRATGGAIATWAGFPKDHFEVLAGEITRFASSPGVQRGFCAAPSKPIRTSAPAPPASSASPAKGSTKK